jgi:kynurenine formamidase
MPFFNNSSSPQIRVAELGLVAGIPIVEHLTQLSLLPAEGFRFSAVPPKIAAMGTFRSAHTPGLDLFDTSH